MKITIGEAIFVGLWIALWVAYAFSTHAAGGWDK